MSWLDTFYPVNSEKRTILAECGKLKALLSYCFTAVNRLIDCIEENFPGEKLEKIDVQKSASVGDNCSIIIDRADQIEKLLSKKAFDLEERVDTTLFKKLKDRKTQYAGQAEIRTKTKYSVTFVSTTVSWLLVATMIKKGYISDNAFSQFGVMAVILFLAMVAILRIGVEVVLSAIYGAFESNDLKHALEEYTSVVEDFEHDVREWDTNIRTLIKKIKMHNRKTDLD